MYMKIILFFESAVADAAKVKLQQKEIEIKKKICVFGVFVWFSLKNHVMVIASAFT